ncbi:DUF1648 domain-containing protein [Arthrobacter sp. TWP1-1]|uniref:DUF1648 domain-containing protein n=1 Tax=Arthrobacter sp. TWP1-1 TaxID=2804568 RepID=UPI003CF2245D
MGDQVREAAAEKRYNRRWLIAAILGPLLLGVMAAGWMFTVADRLPAELATHWNGKNHVDGYSSLWVMAFMTVGVAAGTGALISVLAVVTRGQSLLLARIGLGAGVALAVALTALMVAIAAGQLYLVDVSQAKLSGPVIAIGLALAFVAAAGVIWQYRPGEVDRTQSPVVVAMNAGVTSMEMALSAAGHERAERAETLRIKVSMGAWAWVLSGGIGGIVALSTYFVFPLLALLGVAVGALVWVFCQGTVVIDHQGVRVLASGFWKVMPLEWKEIDRAAVEDIKALDYGGWGYRSNIGSTGFIMNSGPALVMAGGFHQHFVISMPSLEVAGDAAALVNAYVHNKKVKK